MTKKLLLLFIVLILCPIMVSHSKQAESSNTPTLSTSAAVEPPQPSMEVTSSPVPEITANTPIPSASVATETPQSSADITALPISETAEYFSLTKDEIISKFGSNYEIVPAGAEACFVGYTYADIGMSFVFDPSETDGLLCWIDCDEQIDINGAKSGMDFAQIQNILGKTQIHDAFIETPDHPCYFIEYEINGCNYNFMSFNYDGSPSWLTIFLA